MRNLTSTPSQASGRPVAMALVLVSAVLTSCSDTPTKTVDVESPPVAKTSVGAHPAEKNPASPHHSTKHPANRLAKETSPYLLAHAHNPVDWYPWSAEALAKAKKENKLIFLSIGYSSCHWCHVMERKCFMDETIAKYLNDHFICIKVDREERPDVDEVYMTSLHVYFQVVGVSRSGGWPLTMVLSPEAKPIMGDTYIPPKPLMATLKKVQSVWTEQPESLLKSSEQLAGYVQKTIEGQPPLKPVPLNSDRVDSVINQLVEQYDEPYGGFRPRGPKFPEPSNLRLLLEYAAEVKETKEGPEAQRVALGTLDKMAQGGIRDHIGGGFHRYSVDRFWHIPHFEKMLYDNGQLLSAYAAAYQLTGKPHYRRVLEEIIEFSLREMAHEGGGFYSALDADTEGKEGEFYSWTTDELSGALTKDEYALMSDVYSITQGPNFEGEHVPLFLQSLFKTAADRKTTEEDLAKQLRAINQKLLKVRDRRPRPLTDTKILTAWNGLMIRGLADAGRVLKSESTVKTAARAADFVLAKLRTKEGRLLRTYTAGEAKLNGYLDDYAYLVDGLIALHEATGERRWLDTADALTKKQIELFWDEKKGGFYYTSSDHETLFVRTKKAADNVRPAGNSVAAGNLVYLAKALDRPDYLDRAEKTIQSVAPLLERSPTSLPHMARSLRAWLKAKGS